MRGKYRISEREAFQLECEIQEKIEEREQRRRVAFERAGTYDSFPEKVKQLLLSFEAAAEAARGPQERTNAGDTSKTTERDSRPSWGFGTFSR